MHSDVRSRRTKILVARDTKTLGVHVGPKGVVPPGVVLLVVDIGV